MKYRIIFNKTFNKPRRDEIVYAESVDEALAQFGVRRKFMGTITAQPWRDEDGIWYLNKTISLYPFSGVEGGRKQGEIMWDVEIVESMPEVGFTIDLLNLINREKSASVFFQK